MNYWVIEMENGKPSELPPKGPFGSKEAAKRWITKRWIIEDCKALFEHADEVKLGENEDWSTPMIILQEVETIKTTPVVTFTIKTK
jgi:hypothetical protein